MHDDTELTTTTRTRLALLLTLLSLPLSGCADDDDNQDDADTGSETGSTTNDDTTLTSSPTTTVDPDSSGADITTAEPTSTTDDTDDTDDTTTGETASLLDRVVVALGGAASLDALVGFELTVTGQRSVADEGEDPSGAAIPGSDYTATIAVDLDDAGMRLDIDRTITFAGLGLPLTYSEIVSGQLGVVDGVDNLFMGPAGAMPSDRWASTVRQQELLNPHLLIKKAVDDPSLASETGAADYDGRPHERLELVGSVQPITLWVDSETGLVSRLTTTENSWLRRDVEVEVIYGEWEASDGGVLFPTRVTLVVDGNTLADETRDTVSTTVDFPAETFAIPKAAGATYVEEDARRGERNHTILQELVSAGLPNFGQQTFVVGEEIAEGVWSIGGGSHNSMVIEQESGLVLLETPLYEARCEAILGWIDENLPGQSVTHAVVSHFHVDHAACARTLVASGATLVVGEGSDVVWTDVLMAPSTVEPDALEKNPVADPLVEYVPNDGSFTLEDGARPVTVYDLPNAHSDDLVLPFVEAGGVAFVVDLYSPGAPAQLFGPAGAQSVLDAMEQHGILGSVNAVFGGHGFGTATVADLQATAGS